MKRNRISYFLFVLVSLWGWIGFGAEVSLQSRLKNAIIEYQNKLPKLESFQKTLYQEEIIPQYARFIKDYRGGVQGLQIEIDEKAIEHYLQFYGPRVFSQKNPTVRVEIQLGEDCAKCTQSAPILKEIVKNRLDRRGFLPEFNKSKSQATSVGTLVVKAGPVPPDEVDAAHADDENYQVYVRFQLHGTEGFEGKLEVMASETLESAEVKLMNDAMKVVGEQAVVLAANMKNQAEPIRKVKFNFDNYAALSKFKMGLQQIYPQAREKIIEKGKVTFEFNSTQDAQEVKSKLSKLSMDLEVQ